MGKIKTYVFSWAIDGRPDKTQFCTRSEDEAIKLFEDFCADERIDPREVEIDIAYDKDDAAEYGEGYIAYDEYLNLE